MVVVYRFISSFESEDNPLGPIRGCHPEMFLRKCVLKIYSKFTGEYPCRSVISIKLLSNFIEITLWHGCSPVNLLYIFRTPFTKNTSGRLLLCLLIDSIYTCQRSLSNLKIFLRVRGCDKVTYINVRFETVFMRPVKYLDCLVVYSFAR